MPVIMATNPSNPQPDADPSLPSSRRHSASDATFKHVSPPKRAPSAALRMFSPVDSDDLEVETVLGDGGRGPRSMHGNFSRSRSTEHFDVASKIAQSPFRHTMAYSFKKRNNMCAGYSACIHTPDLSLWSHQKDFQSLKWKYGYHGQNGRIRKNLTIGEPQNLSEEYGGGINVDSRKKYPHKEALQRRLEPALLATVRPCVWCSKRLSYPATILSVKGSEVFWTPSTVMTNLSRGNVQTTTPSIYPSLTVHQLAAQGEVVLLQQELQDGIDVNYVDDNGFTALHWACANGQLGTVEFLIKNGGDISVAGNQGETPLLLAACYGYIEIVKFLLSIGADVNYADEGGNTALMYAAYNNHATCITPLLESGCDLTATNEDQLTAFDLAVAQGNKQAQQAIERYMLSLFETSGSS